MAIKDAEERALWPRLLLPRFRLQDVEDDAHSVLVHFLDDAFVGVGSICSDPTVLLGTDFAEVHPRVTGRNSGKRNHLISHLRIIDDIVHQVLPHTWRG